MPAYSIPEDVFFLDRASGVPLQVQLREAIVSGILAGRLAAGARMPSTRRLASHAGVSRITVSLAYQELVSQGYLVSRERSSYAVADMLPELSGQRPESESEAAVNWTQKLPRSFEPYRHIEKPKGWRGYRYPFIYGQMDPALFDVQAWRDCSRRALAAREFAEMAGDVAMRDDPQLVDYICSRSLPRRGIEAGPDEVLVTLGAQNALWLAIELMARPGFHAAIENPGYPDIATALRWNGARVTAVDVDARGLPPAHVPADIDAVFVTPSHQTPTAATLPMDRREALIAAAETHDFVIVEDDYDFEMSFLAAPSPALKSLDRLGRVIYVGSFSKALFPGLRLGYLVAAPEVIDAARRLRALMLRHPPGHLQRTTAHFLALGYYDQLIRRMRNAFAQRREVLMNALHQSGIEICGSAEFGGTNLWVGAPEGTDSTGLALLLRSLSVLIEPGTPFFQETDRPIRYFRLGYSSIPVERIDQGVRRIAAAIHRLPLKEASTSTPSAHSAD